MVGRLERLADQALNEGVTSVIGRGTSRNLQNRLITFQPHYLKILLAIDIGW